jgi:glutamine amidotransferase
VAMISILNYGFGNIASISNMLKKVGAPNKVITTAKEIYEATALILPGIGKYDHAIKQIETLGLMNALDNAALVRRIPVLGICLGMQLMTKCSEEGLLQGLGWIDATTCRLNAKKYNIRVPHMGWNLVKFKKNEVCFKNQEFEEQKFYFVHSFAVFCKNPEDILTTTEYGEEFVSAFAKDNIVGVQFHPEKSHKFGASFLRHFVSTYCNA